MRRLLRILLNAATALSLALSVATAVLWVRSYHHADSYAWPNGRYTQGVSSTLGHCRYISVSLASATDAYLGRPRRPEYRGWHSRTLDDNDRPRFRDGGGYGRGEWAFAGAQFVTGDYKDHWNGYTSTPYWGCSVPTWWLTMSLAILPVARVGARGITRWRGGRRLGSCGCCAACGYDLRATPDRCPECGAVPASATQKT